MNLHEINNIEDLNKALKYIYDIDDDDANLVTEENLKWIKKGNKEIYEKFIENQPMINNWLDCNKKVLEYYGKYLEEMSKKPNDEIEILIEILIISEAPMLTLEEDGNFTCKYILGEGNPGSYRTVPFESIWEFKKGTIEKPKGYNTKSDKITELFIEHKVAFIDLIPFPLPKVPTDLRKEWRERSEHTFIKSLFIQAIDHFKLKTNRDFAENLKIVFMMPTTTAYGIIEYCIENGSNCEHEFINKYKEQMIRCNDNTIFSNDEMYNYSISLHRQIAMCGSGGPVKNLFLNALKE